MVLSRDPNDVYHMPTVAFAQMPIEFKMFVVVDRIVYSLHNISVTFSQFQLAFVDHVKTATCFGAKKKVPKGNIRATIFVHK